ncbi:MAG: vitamin B12-dependent ribonucleotide reductase [Phycisphaerales bacterium]|nr:vitamin B12-dependent ribonucleotide reductase [Phycisphaerales bacterium]
MTHQDSTNSLHESKDSKATAQTPAKGKGLKIPQVFSTPGTDPFDSVSWETSSAHITDDKGGTIFEQTDVEKPVDWSQLATTVVVSKYFYGEHNSPERENSIRGMVNRVTRTIADLGKADGVFADDDDAERFYNELSYLCVNQYGAFNSPVWFNVGLFHQYGVEGSEGNCHWNKETDKPERTMRSYEYPQASACFIQSVDDTMEDIMRLAQDEAMLFKYGSGTGTDLSTLRSSRETLSGGGTPSGPLSFMRIFDQIAAVVRSGGKTRRAAKMQSLQCDHPDIKEFISCKMVEERKAWALIEQGYDGSFNGEAYASVMYQNANLSIRVTDDFMDAAVKGTLWTTHEVTGDKKPSVQYPANELLELIAEGTHVCGDPGVQYHTTINKWHTCADDGPINASNPCSEYMFLNDSACNLASLNLMKFRREDGSMDTERMSAAARIFVIAQEILVDNASYPGDLICTNSHNYRPLGLGYANLGALLMSLGLPYDSDEGRATAGALTAILTGTAYATSAELAESVGPFAKFEQNRKSMLKVMKMHRAAIDGIDTELCPDALLESAKDSWAQAIEAGMEHGYRNAQVTVLAPTGTIGFMMDCDTTGIEPDIALVKYKQLAGGGMFKIINQTVSLALQRLGYDSKTIDGILTHISQNDTIEDAPGLKDEHLPVFDCAFKPADGTRCIHHMGHIRMMGAAQPFISGAISKTVNIPNEATIEEIQGVYVDAWNLGLKAVAIYRDGSKRIQPLNVSKDASASKSAQPVISGISQEELDAAVRKPHRRRLPATRPSITHKFSVARHEGYLSVGLYEDGTPGELFISMSKEGSTVGGMMDTFATALSLCLQYGVPLESLVKKFSHQRFDPHGMTDNRDIPMAKSIVDYIFRWLGLQFLGEEYRNKHLPKRPAPKKKKTNKSESAPNALAPEAVKDDAPSEPGRVGKAPDTEVCGQSDALIDVEGYAPAGGSGGGGNGGGGINTATSASVKTALRLSSRAEPRTASVSSERIDRQFEHFQEDAPACDVCGSLTVRNGNCYKCFNCGSSLGCS